MVAVHRRDDEDGPEERAPLPLRRAPLALVRCDTLPEHADYVDTGCELAPSCLNCPLPQCKYDAPRRKRHFAKHARDREIAVLRRKYAAPVDAIAETYGISRRQVFRILKAARIDATAGHDDPARRSRRLAPASSL